MLLIKISVLEMTLSWIPDVQPYRIEPRQICQQDPPWPLFKITTNRTHCRIVNIFWTSIWCSLIKTFFSSQDMFYISTLELGHWKKYNKTICHYLDEPYLIAVKFPQYRFYNMNMLMSRRETILISSYLSMHYQTCTPG